jgi:hypothetical protein
VLIDQLREDQQDALAVETVLPGLASEPLHQAAFAEEEPFDTTS